jgi:hypothetical protein
VHTRRVSPETLFGEITIPVRTFQCRGCGATFRHAERRIVGPEVGDCTDDVRLLYAPVVAELPHRVANDLLPRGTGVALSSRGAPGIIDRPAADLTAWQAARETQEAEAMMEALAASGGAVDLRVELAMDGVMAHIEGRWQEAKVATILVRQREAQAAAPPSARSSPAAMSASWGQRRSWPPAANRSAARPAGSASRWGRSWEMASLDLARGGYPLSQGASDTGRLASQRAPLCLRASPLPQQSRGGQGLGGGSGAAEGACKHVMHSRFTRAGRRWQQSGFLNVLAWRLASLNGTFQAFWASRGLRVPASG